MNPSDAAKRVLELDGEATSGEWEYDDENYIFRIEKGDWTAMIAEIRGEGDKLPCDANANLIAEYRTLAPLLAKHVLELEAKLKVAVEALERIPSKDPSWPERDRICKEALRKIRGEG